MFLLNLRNEALQYSIIFYLLSLTLFNIIKPPMFYDENKEIKKFGIAKDKILFPFPIISLIISIFVYLFITIYN